MTHINSEDEQDVLLFKASELGNNLFYDKRELTYISVCSMSSLNIVLLALEAWMQVGYFFRLPHQIASIHFLIAKLLQLFLLCLSVSVWGYFFSLPQLVVSQFPNQVSNLCPCHGSPKS